MWVTLEAEKCKGTNFPLKLGNGKHSHANALISTQ